MRGLVGQTRRPRAIDDDPSGEIGTGGCRAMDHSRGLPRWSSG